jgi:TPR repeat protein
VEDSDGLLDHEALMAREADVPRLQEAYELLSTDREHALAPLEELAGRGSVLSMLYLAQTYGAEPGGDRAKAEKWYRLAYERGSSTALFALGSLYYRERNYDEAEKIFKDGASKNDGVSMYWLASTYVVDTRHTGKSAEIKELLERSMALGQVYAQHDLGLFLLKGRYGLKNIPRGLYLFSQISS